MKREQQESVRRNVNWNVAVGLSSQNWVTDNNEMARTVVEKG